MNDPDNKLREACIAQAVPLTWSWNLYNTDKQLAACVQQNC